MLALCLVASALLATLYLGRFLTPPETALRSAIKTGAIAALAVGAWAVGGPTALILGLALGAVGDFFLSRPGDQAFLAGVAAFAASHIAYIWLLAENGGRPEPSFALLVLTILAIGMATLLWRHAGALRWAVSAYIAIITAMGILAVSLPLSLAWPALAFIASDTVLALEKFVLTQSTRSMVWTSRFIWISYWVAQAGFLGMFAIVAGA